MKEYWVNVWKEPIGAKQCPTIYGPPHTSIISAIECNHHAYKEKRIAYRIHVKMKEPKPIDRQIPVKLDYTALKKYHWMDN